MKVLIWFLCIFVNALITTIAKESGVTLGAIPTVILFAGMMWLAQTLCKKWDEHKEDKPKNKKKPVQNSQNTDNKAKNQILFCRKCGEPLIDNSQFCRKCGAEIVKE
ncbi:MAG: zinc ribbon domain-containing protein [Clostridia bacterium]|nr:zinc ribbon domain-containing protein [Clostridia bacterium]